MPYEGPVTPSLRRYNRVEAIGFHHNFSEVEVFDEDDYEEDRK